MHHVCVWCIVHVCVCVYVCVRVCVCVCVCVCVYCACMMKGSELDEAALSIQHIWLAQLVHILTSVCTTSLCCNSIWITHKLGNPHEG